MVRQARPLGRRFGPSFRRPLCPTPPHPADDARRQYFCTLVVLAWLALAVALRSI